MERLRPHLDLLKALGANVLVFAETTDCRSPPAAIASARC